MRRIIILTFFILFVTVSGQAQIERQAGIRSGYGGGLFYQVTGESGSASNGYMAILGFRKNGVQLTGLRIIYETSIDELSPDLYLSWGYGLHAGFIVTDRLRFFGERYYFETERFCPVFGIDGWGSLEYRFRSVPLAISLNIKPMAEITIPTFFSINPIDLGLSIAYTF
ncbi:MAG: hypothetical protein U0X39_03745 [Bacteroidales bacterium]